MTPVAPEQSAAIFAGLAFLMAALALFLFIRLVAARRKARLWEEYLSGLGLSGYTLERRKDGVRMKRVLP